VGLWWANAPDDTRLAGLVTPSRAGVSSANSQVAESNPPEKRKVAGSIPALATTFDLHRHGLCTRLSV
jgi:hypothetical protein